MSYMKFLIVFASSWEPQLCVNKNEAKYSLLIVRHLLLLYTNYALFLNWNVRLYSSAEAGIVLNLFLNFEKKWAACSYSYKIVLITKKLMQKYESIHLNYWGLYTSTFLLKIPSCFWDLSFSFPPMLAHLNLCPQRAIVVLFEKEHVLNILPDMIEHCNAKYQIQFLFKVRFYGSKIEFFEVKLR